jgi:hypothetical protein
MSLSREVIECRIWCHIAHMREAAALTFARGNPYVDTSLGPQDGPGRRMAPSPPTESERPCLARSGRAATGAPMPHP